MAGEGELSPVFSLNIGFPRFLGLDGVRWVHWVDRSIPSPKLAPNDVKPFEKKKKKFPQSAAECRRRFSEVDIQNSMAKQK